MTSEGRPSPDDGSLSAIIAAYLDALDGGEPTNPEELTARYPEHAVALRDFFRTHDRLEELARPLRGSKSPGVSEARGLAPEEAPGSQPNSQVRYFGDYELHEEIARGGMGVVYRARQVSLNRPVAVKMIRAGQLADEREVRRFRDEAAAAANLDHPNIVPIYEVGEHDGQHYFSMKLIEGGNLNDALARFEDDPQAVARLMVAVARAVHHAHQRGILHRDLKPSNILIDRDGNPHVTDFGLAERLEQDGKMTHSEAVVGTPEYMAPEQARGEKGLTTAADVYGLGAVLYFLLTGRPPFQGDYNWDTIKKVVEQEPVRPRSVTHGVDRDLETICLHCLRKAPGKRYGSAEAVADDLQRWLEGKPIHARPVGRCELAIKWVRRNPASASLLALVFVVLLGGLAATYRQYAQTLLALQAVTEANEQIKTVNANLQIQLNRTERTMFNAQLWRVESIYREDPHAAYRLLHDTKMCPIPLRSAAWHFYVNQCRPAYLKLCQSDAPCSDPVLNLNGHSSRVTSVTYSADSKIFASASQEVILWNPATGKSHAILKGNPRSIHTAIVSPDTKTLALACDIWSNETQQYCGGEILLVPQKVKVDRGGNQFSIDWEAAVSLQHPARIAALVYSADGRAFASAGEDGRLVLWDLTTRKPGMVVQDTATHLALSPDGRHLASSGGKSNDIRLWNVATGELTKKFAGHAAQVNGLCFSPDGGTLASASDDGTIKVWQLKGITGPLTLSGHKGRVGAVAFRHDAKQLASGGADRTLRIWDLETGKNIVSHATNAKSSVGPLVYTNDGRSIIFAEDEGYRGYNVLGVQSRSVTGGLPRPQPVSGWFGQKKRLTHLAVHRGSVFVAAYADPCVAIGEIRSGELGELRIQFAALQAEQVYSVAISPDNRTLAAAEHTVDPIKKQTLNLIRLWDIKTRTLRATISSLDDVTIRSVVFSPDGRTLATASNWQGAGSIRIWDSQSGQMKAMLPSAGVMAIAFSPDGKKLVSGGVNDHKVRLWDVQTTKVIADWEGHSSEVTCVAFSPDGTRVASGSHDNTIRLWDAVSGKELAVLRGHTISVRSLAFSPDNVTLASASGVYTSEANHLNARARGIHTEMKLWDIITFQEVASVPAHSHDIYALAFSPNGQQLATASGVWAASENQFGAGDIKLWDLRSYPLQAVVNHGRFGLGPVHFSPDSRTFVSVNCRDHSGILWDVLSGKERWSFPCISDERARRALRGIAYSADSRLIATVTHEWIHVWDVAGGIKVKSLRLPARVSASEIDAVRFGPDNRQVGVRTGKMARVWELETGVARQPLSIDLVPWLGDDVTIRSKQGDKDTLIRLAAPSDRSWTVPGFHDSDHLLLSGNKRILAVQINRQLYWFDVRSDKVHSVPLGEDSAEALDPTGELVACKRSHRVVGRDGKPLVVHRWTELQSADIVLRDLATGSIKDILVGWLTRDVLPNDLNYIRTIRFSPDRRTLVSTDAYGTILMWKLNRNAE